MCIDPADPSSLEPVRVDEMQHLFMSGERNCRECIQQAEDLVSPPQVATRQLADNERMADGLSFVQQLREMTVPSAQVIHPDGGVDENHFAP